MGRRRLGFALLAAASALASTTAAGAAGDGWAAAQIRAVTKAGILGSSPAAFAPQAPLTQQALSAAIAATDVVRRPPVAAAPTRVPVLQSSLAPAATIGGIALWQAAAPGQRVDHVDFAVDGVTVSTARTAPYAAPLDTRRFSDGPHRLTLTFAFADGVSAGSTWTATVANAPGAVLSAPAGLVTVPGAKPSAPVVTAVPTRTLYRATAPAQPVSIKQLDAALVAYAGLGAAAREIQATLVRAGLDPPANTGTEAVARMLGLRLNHPQGQDELELLPGDAATRAEAAWSFAQLLRLDDRALESVQQAADAFTLPDLTQWQRQLLRTAVSYVGYPYIWGGTSPVAQTLYGARVSGGFDCSGFVWRVVKLTPYTGGAALASVLRGRTTYEMSGEVPARQRIAAAKLQPADVMFFGAHGPASKPAEVDHAGLYLGNGWFVQSSGAGVTLLPFDGWYTRSFAWARRALREARLG